MYDPQRHFVTMLLGNLVRLSYRSRVAKDLPEEFHCLLPPEPVAPETPPEDAQDATAALVAETCKLARAKTPAPDMQAWLEGEATAEVPPPQRLGAVLRGLLMTGSKSFTHMIVLLERYHGVLSPLAKMAGADVRHTHTLSLSLGLFCRTCNARGLCTSSGTQMHALLAVMAVRLCAQRMHRPGSRCDAGRCPGRVVQCPTACHHGC